MMSNITMTFAGFYYMAGVLSGIFVTFLVILLMHDGKDKEREGCNHKRKFREIWRARKTLW